MGDGDARSCPNARLPSAPRAPDRRQARPATASVHAQRGSMGHAGFWSFQAAEITRSPSRCAVYPALTRVLVRRPRGDVGSQTRVRRRAVGGYKPTPPVPQWAPDRVREPISVGEPIGGPADEALDRLRPVPVRHRRGLPGKGATTESNTLDYSARAAINSDRGITSGSGAVVAERGCGALSSGYSDREFGPRGKWSRLVELSDAMK